MISNIIDPTGNGSILRVQFNRIFVQWWQGEILLIQLIINSHQSIVILTLQLFHDLIAPFLPIYYTVFEIVQFFKSISIKDLSSYCTAVS